MSQTVSAPVDGLPGSAVRRPGFSPRLPLPEFSTVPVCEMGMTVAAPHFSESEAQQSSVPGSYGITITIVVVIVPMPVDGQRPTELRCLEDKHRPGRVRGSRPGAGGGGGRRD